MHRILRLFFVAVVATLGGCSTIGYYSQSIGGHLRLMSKRVPIERALADPDLSSEIRTHLHQAQQLRQYASLTLNLPDNESYTAFADVGNAYVVWNVVATPEFSLQPKRWCYLVVGCLSYRGFFDEADARSSAQALRAQGYDVFVGGVRAYSTLGWFDDPVLSTMLTDSSTYLAGVLFHELAHQVVYVSGDTSFNESFAVAVEREGVRRWLRDRGEQSQLAHYEVSQRQAKKFVELMLEARQALRTLYDTQTTAEQLRAGKQGILHALRNRYLSQAEHIGAQYAAWFEEDLNNAHFALIATYHDHVDVFEQLLRANSDWSIVFEQVKDLAERPFVDRFHSRSEGP